jgi:Ca2+/Na+ antiporter
MSSSITSKATSMINTMSNINTKINKVFQNPNINFFIIMNLILLISCYTFINTPLKTAISSFVSNPLIILFSLILIIIVGYHNINIAILSLLLLFVVLFGSTLFNKNNTNYKNNKNNNTLEGFRDPTTKATQDDEAEETEEEQESDEEAEEEQDQDDKDIKLEKSEKEFEKKTKEDKTNSRENTINSIKDVLLGSFNKIKNGAENEYKKGLVENKKMLYENEKNNNKQTVKNVNNKNNKNSKNSNKKSSKEEFQTIDTRAFDPSSEEDTNLLITKEVLQDMINRIDYKFETNIYLKKYLKHRIEEIVELNKLLDEDED